MFCQDCGEDNKETDKFCKKCGGSLTTVASITKKRKGKFRYILPSAIGVIVLAFIAIYWLAFRETAKDYFPREGASMVYMMLTKDGKNVALRFVAGKKEEFQGSLATPLHVKGGSGNLGSEFYKIDSDGIVVVGSIFTATTTFEPGIKLFKFPLKRGDSWDGSCIQKQITKEGAKHENVTASFSVLDKETVRTPAGEFSCWKIERKSERGTILKRISWYANKIGRIKFASYYSDGGYEEGLLQSYSLK